MFDILWICLTYCIGSVPFGLVFAVHSLFLHSFVLRFENDSLSFSNC